jgi:hypothetical protein
MNVPAEPVELGHQDRAFAAPRLREGCGKLWPAIESVGVLAGLDLLELGELPAAPLSQVPSDPERRSIPGNRQ